MDAYRLAVSGGRLLAAGGAGGLGVFELFSAPFKLEALAGTTPQTLTLKLNGPEGTTAIVQLSTDLVTWHNSQEVPLTASPVAITVPANEGGEFFRLKKL